MEKTPLSQAPQANTLSATFSAAPFSIKDSNIWSLIKSTQDPQAKSQFSQDNQLRAEVSKEG